MPRLVQTGLHWDASFGPEGPAQIVTNCDAVNHAAASHRVAVADAINALVADIEDAVGKLTPDRKLKVRAAVVRRIHAIAGDAFTRGCDAEKARVGFNKSGSRNAERDAAIVSDLEAIMASDNCKLLPACIRLSVEGGYDLEVSSLQSVFQRHKKARPK